MLLPALRGAVLSAVCRGREFPRCCCAPVRYGVLSAFLSVLPCTTKGAVQTDSIVRITNGIVLALHGAIRINRTRYGRLCSVGYGYISGRVRGVPLPEFLIPDPHLPHPPAGPFFFPFGGYLFLLMDDWTSWHILLATFFFTASRLEVGAGCPTKPVTGKEALFS